MDLSVPHPVGGPVAKNSRQVAVIWSTVGQHVLTPVRTGIESVLEKNGL